MTYFNETRWTNRELFLLLTNYAQARYPREKASLLQIAIGRVMALAPSKEYMRRLEELSRKIEDIAFGINWEVYMAYSYGQYDLISSDEYWKMMDALKELDRIALEVSRIIGDIDREWAEEGSEFKEKIGRDW